MSANAAESGFFVRHVEKFVLGVVMLLVGFFIYSGMSIEPFPEKQTPDDLKTLAARAEKTIEQDSWSNVQDEPERATKDITIRLHSRDEVMTPIPSDPYQPQMAWSNPEFRLQAKRTDPELYPAINLEVSAHYGPVALLARDGDEDLLLQDQLVEEEEPKRRGRRKDDDDEDDLLSGPGGLSGMMGVAGGAGSEIRSLNEEQLGNLEGYRPGSSGGGGMSSMGGMGGMGAEMMSMGNAPGASGNGTVAAGSVIHKGLRFVAIKAVVPYKKQWFENESVLQDAVAYNPLRDIPKYVYYKVERAEVGNDPNAKLEWKELSTRRAQAFARLWGGRSDEVVDPRYLDPQLSFPAPPLMMRSGDFALHSQTPRKRVFDQSATLQRKPVEESLDGPDRPDVPGGPVNGLIGPGATGMNPGAMGAGGENAMMEGMNGMEEGGSGYGAGMGAGMAAGMGGMGAGMGGMTGASPTGGAPDVDYKLFRFYDFTVEPKKRYRYRIQLWLEDVNYPRNPQLAPPASSLSDAVSRRVNEKKAADAASKSRKYWRETEWSEPSDIVSVPRQYQVYAGMVRTDKPVVIRDKGISYPKPGGEPNAQMMAVVWNPKYGADIPGIINVFRGSVLDFTQNADVLHPMSLNILTLPEYKYQTGNIVLDIRGGDALPSLNSSLKASDLSPGEFLLIDSAGEMVVHNELDDLVSFRNLDFRKPPEPKKRKEKDKDEDGMEGMTGMEAGMFGGGDDEGGGRGRSRGRSRGR